MPCRQPIKISSKRGLIQVNYLTLHLTELEEEQTKEITVIIFEINEIETRKIPEIINEIKSYFLKM